MDFFSTNMLLSARGDASAEMQSWLMADGSKGKSRVIESEAESQIAKISPDFRKRRSAMGVGSKDSVRRGGVSNFPRAINPKENKNV